VDRARAVLARALQEADVPAVWSEWDTDDPECPENRKAYGSPTILVNGKDVAPGPHQWSPRDGPSGPRCRLYRDGNQNLGAPPLPRVTAAIQSALGPDVV